MDKIVTIIGGIAVDIEGIPYKPLILLKILVG